MLRIFPSKRFLAASALALLLISCGLRTRYSMALTWGESMSPTLQHCDLLIVDTWSYKHEEPMRGDVVIARARGDVLVKRIVGLPGESIEVRAGAVFINDARLFEDYASDGNLLAISKGTLRGKYALVGDNRSLPVEQLVHAVAAKEEIVGKVKLSLRLVPRRLLQSFQTS
ncbi:MAG TPA: signal peptidase I [Methylomirabilota bacterium]|nr:signal peptidase I [Methylomirabilota bacterium]